MESFFGRVKQRILKLIALCPAFDVAKRMIDDYMDRYNNKNYQYSLAALSPAEFYEYTQTSVYTLNEYFGMKASELDERRKLIDTRIESAE